MKVRALLVDTARSALEALLHPAAGLAVVLLLLAPGIPLVAQGSSYHPEGTAKAVETSELAAGTVVQLQDGSYIALPNVEATPGETVALYRNGKSLAGGPQEADPYIMVGFYILVGGGVLYLLGVALRAILDDQGVLRD